LSKNVKNNLESIIAIRHEVEHKLFSRADPIFFSKFQANALNFDKTIRELFGEKLSLNSELSLALQFSKLQLDQIKVLQEYDVPPSIQALDAQLNSNLTEEEKESIEYQFKVIYSLESSSKSKNHFQFIQPGSVEGKQIHNILTKLKFADDHYPYRTKDVYSEIINKTGEKFNQHHHRQAWSLYQIRPKGGAKNPENTNKEFCVYNKVWKGYSYSQSWVDYLVECIKDKEKYKDILAHKP
ncbi:MAG: hypothetical protein JNK86_03045, partial [Alphaproteobacteria bacterium]|nr:hypothetical protein [Alphaproteobacteria bacterium]